MEECESYELQRQPVGGSSSSIGNGISGSSRARKLQGGHRWWRAVTGDGGGDLYTAAFRIYRVL